MSDNQQRLIWIGAGILGVVYFAPDIIMTVRSGLAPQGAARNPTASRSAPGPGIKVLGKWRGRTIVPDKGTCLLKLEVNPVPTGFSAFSTFQCEHLAKPNATFPEIVSPPAAVLTGAVDKGTIRLNAEKTVGTDSTGCVAGPFILTPFSNGQVAVEWTQGPCLGAHILVHRGS